MARCQGKTRWYPAVFTGKILLPEIGPKLNQSINLINTMKKILRVTGIIILSIILSLFIFIQIRHTRKFDAPFPSVIATTDTAVIARGRELVFGAAHCANCHAPEQQSTLSNNQSPILLSGGIKFQIPLGDIFSPNLTPDKTGILYKTDQALARALRYGVSTDGRALFDFMPFHHTSDEDLTAIISYLRSQPPVVNQVPENDMNLLGKAIKALVLKPAGPTEKVPMAVKRDTTADYGRYLANNIANCQGCHTNRDLMTGAFIGQRYAGGFTMESKTDSGTFYVTSPNLTPHNTGRIKGWSQEQFIGRFRQGRVIKTSHMPWEPFSKMKEDDLKAIYKYLQTLQPIDNYVAPGIRLEK
ncbi:MAG: c-type cytochrome [Chitinophagaceae bacterium]|nr:MAG: c-type cytochrome [Chitinophagaceae bacterium]